MRVKSPVLSGGGREGDFEGMSDSGLIDIENKRNATRKR